MTTAESFLRDFHDGTPSATPRSLGWGRLASGESSYEHLASVIPGGTDRASVLDLACGDGVLVRALRPRVSALEYTGIDISERDLDQAREAYPESNLSFRGERAQAMTLPTGTVDYVLSHMAFMLLDDLDIVVREIARVLKPGGVFAAVIGGALDESDAFSVFVRQWRDASERGEVRDMRLGDNRVHSADGIHDLFSASAGFVAPVEIDDDWLILDADLNRVWSSLALTYNVACLSDEGRETLERLVREQLGALARDDGTIPFRLGVRRITARRAPA